MEGLTSSIAAAYRQPMEWESLEDTAEQGSVAKTTERARIRGGWIVRTTVRADPGMLGDLSASHVAVAMVYVPDADHAWAIGS